MMCSGHKSTNDSFRKNYDSVFSKQKAETENENKKNESVTK